MVKLDSISAAAIIFTTPLRSWESDWRKFNQFCPKLAQAASGLSSLYCLPKPAIDILVRKHSDSLPMFDHEAETAFTELCQNYKAIGCWPDRPIMYPFLSHQSEWPADGQTLQMMGWSSAQQLQVKEGRPSVEDASLRLKGYAGWLLTEPAFLAEAEKLMSSWLRLPDPLRPPLPIARPISQFKLPKNAKRSPQPLAKFSRASRKFLDHWGLVEMTTWELPKPQGPFLPNELPPGSPAVPVHGVHLILPLHYPLQGDDGLLQQIQDFQRQLAREQGLDETLAGLPHYKAYANMLEVVHWEQVIRSRFRVGKRLPGLVTWIEEVIAGILGSGLAGVQKLRKAISSCRKDQRARVTWLQPRKR